MSSLVTDRYKEAGLPPGWAEAMLGEIAETRLGKMLSKKAKTGSMPRPYLRNKNVQWGRIDLDDLLEMDFGDVELERFRVTEGDLLVCEGGEVGRAAIWRGQVDWIGYQKALHRVRPAGGVASDYLLYCFMWLAQSHAFELHVTGSTIKHLPQEDLRQVVVPVPPLNEQRRIVAAIEEHLSRLDAAQGSLGACLQRAEAMRRAVLAAALEPISSVRPLGDVAATQLGKMLSAKAKTGVGARPYLRNKNVQWGRIDTDDLLVMDFSERDEKKFHLGTGDVLVCEGGEVGRAAVWRGQVPGCCFQKALHRVRVGDGLMAEFLVHVLRWFADRNAFEPFVTGSTIKHLPQEDLRLLPIPFPPLEEQRRIVARVEEQLSAIDALRATIERAQRRSASLRRAILERAFRGELVPQDPSDEPAEHLLARLRADRPSGRRISTSREAS